MSQDVDGIDPQRLRRQPVAAALAIALAGLGLVCDANAAASADNAETSWIRLRTDSTRRIFPTLPAPHAPSRARAAAGTPVTNCADDGIGSLRRAVKAANDGDTIDFSQLTCSTITLETGAIVIPVDNLSLIGPGQSRLAIDGGGLDRVIVHPYGGALQLSGMTLRNGHDRAYHYHVAGGGCIASGGYLTLAATTVTNCYAGGEGGYGGALYAYSLTMSNSTLSNSVAKGVHDRAGTAAFGGAAFVYAIDLVDSTITGNRAIHQINGELRSYDIGGALVTVTGGSIRNCTIDSNYSQERGGGIAAFRNIVVSNSTLSGNVAASSIGGALLMRWPSTIELSNSTITANRGGSGGGGIWLSAPGSLMRSTIVTGNFAAAGPDMESNVSTSINGDHNLVGNSNPRIFLPDDTVAADARLGPLTENGGPTRTHALLRGSAAVDAGTNPLGIQFDQRGGGYPRLYGASPDIGAFEQQALIDPPTPVPSLSMRWLGVLAASCGLLGVLRARRRQNNKRAANCS